MKKAILVTSFGTSHKDTRKKCLDSIQREVEEKYGNENVERAYTSGIIRRIIEKNEGIHIFDQKEGLKVLKDKGFEEIITMSLHILDGIEYSKLDDKFGKISKPLLADDEDFKKIVENKEFNDLEDDDAYRNRIRLRPRAFSVAGPHGAYQYYTLTSHQDIKDSYIYTPSATPGIVKIIPLLKNGELPSQEILEKIKEKLADDVRPLTDKIEIEKPKIQSYNIDIKYWTKKGDNPILVKKEVEAAFSEYIYWQKEKLGRDINPNKLTQLLILAGAKRVEITSPIFQKIEKDTVAKELTKSIKYIGEEDE